MDMSVFHFASGSVIVSNYSRDDISPTSGIRVKNVVNDIYRNLESFNEKIHWINKVMVEKGKTIADVLDEYTKAEGTDKFIMCQAGLLNSDIPVSGNAEEALNVIESQKGYILEAYFYNIIFNRKMALSYSNPDICIYSNDKTEAWIKDNMGEDKIINRVMASSKIS